MRHDMKPIILISFLFISCQLFPQDNDIIKLAFEDKSNFDITKSLGNRIPHRFFILSKTDTWNPNRFHLKENLQSDSVKKKILSDEHHPYNNSYIFKDSILARLLSDNEKTRLFQMAHQIKKRQMTHPLGEFLIINSFKIAENGFLFSITDPIFSSDRQFAFLDITTYKKDNESTDLNDSYFGTTLLIYKYNKGKGWTRLKKIQRIIL